MNPIPIAEVFHEFATGYFGYRYFFEGRLPHHTLAAYPTVPASSSDGSWAAGRNSAFSHATAL
jgi:hypothetical protein